MSRRDGDDRLGRLEVLGAWLGLWTPPRGTTVPPVPKRALAITTVVLVATAGTLAAVMLPRVAADRRAAEERADRAQAQRHAAFLATVDRQQRPTTVHGRRDPGAAPDARRIAARRALLASAVAAIGRDAPQRTGKHVRGVDCEPFPRTLDRTPPVRDLGRSRAAFDCLAVTARFEGGAIGINFRLVVDFGRGRYAWCRIVPLDDRDRLSHPLPRACR